MQRAGCGCLSHTAAAFFLLNVPGGSPPVALSQGLPVAYHWNPLLLQRVGKQAKRSIIGRWKQITMVRIKPVGLPSSLKTLLSKIKSDYLLNNKTVCKLHHRIHQTPGLCRGSNTTPQMKWEIPEGFYDFWIGLKQPERDCKYPSTAGQQTQANRVVQGQQRKISANWYTTQRAAMSHRHFQGTFWRTCINIV